MEKIGKILLVDDDEVTCYINRNLLESMEIAHQVESVHNGMQALQFIKGKYIGTAHPDYITDLLFLDLDMPVMDGVNFLEELKKLNNIDRSKLKIIVLTSSENKKDAEEVNLYHEIVYSYITKPLLKEKIKELISTIN